MTTRPTQGGKKRIANPAANDDRISPKLIGSIVSVGSLAFIGILTETVMTVLFPELMVEFSVNTATVQWITTIYLLSVGVTMPVSSYLKRRFTMKSVFVAAVALAVVGSFIMIVGTSFPVIIVARVIQGVGSGIATPLMINIILEQSPRSKVGRLMGVGSLVITVAPAHRWWRCGQYLAVAFYFRHRHPRYCAHLVALRTQVHHADEAHGGGESESVAIPRHHRRTRRHDSLAEPRWRGRK